MLGVSVCRRHKKISDACQLGSRPRQKDEIIPLLYGAVAYGDQYDEWVRQYRIA